MRFPTKKFNIKNPSALLKKSKFTAGECRSGPGVEIIDGVGSHEGQLHVRVRVDPARHHDTISGINYLFRFRYYSIGNAM